MDQLNEYSKEVVDRFIKSMGYDPEHIDRDKRMAFTKTIRFQQFAARMGDVKEDNNWWGDEKPKPEPKIAKDPKHYKKTPPSKSKSYKDFGKYATKAYEEVEEAMEFPQGDFDAKGTSTKVVGEKKLSKHAKLIKSIYKEHRIREELYDHEKDDKDGTTYGKKPKLSTNKQEVEQQGGQSDKKTQAAAVLSGGTTLTGQKRDTVEIDPLLKKGKPGSPSGEVGNTKQ